MLNWITDYIAYVETRPQDFNIDIKNNVRQIKELIGRHSIEYKKADPEAFEELCRKAFHHREGAWAGKPLELNMEQKYMVACILGIKEYSKEHKRWLRYFNEFDLFVARKWGKDHFIAPLLCWFLGFDKEPTAWGQIVAENSKQSKRTFEIVEKQIKYDPLSRMFKKKGTQEDKQILCAVTDGKLEYLSGRTKGKDGSNPSFGVANEVHEVINHNQYNAIKSGMGAREQPMMIVISTAGITPESLYETLHDRNRLFLRKPKLGKSDRIFAMMYGIDDTDDVSNDNTWIKANPAMYEGRPTLKYLRQQYASMKDDPIMLNTFISKHLNRQVGASLDFYNMIDIKKCMAKVKQSDFYDTYATGGVDLSSTTDLTNATARIIKPNGKAIILQAYFMAEDCLKRNSKKDKMDYLIYSEMETDNEITSKLFIVTKGSEVDYRCVVDWFICLRDTYKVSFLKIGYDRAMANYFINDMVERGGFRREVVTFDKDSQVEDRDTGELTPIYQGYALDPAIRKSRNNFADGRYIYDSKNKLLPYCFYNTRVVNNVDNKMSINKKKSNGHVDGCIGLLNSEIAYDRAKEVKLYKESLSNLLTNF